MENSYDEGSSICPHCSRPLLWNSFEQLVVILGEHLFGKCKEVINDTTRNRGQALEKSRISSKGNATLP